MELRQGEKEERVGMGKGEGCQEEWKSGKGVER